MKKILAMLLVLALLSALAGCGSNGTITEAPTQTTTQAPAEATEEPTTEPSTEPTTEAPTETEAPSADVGLAGTIEGNTYENPLAGIGCALDENWYVFSEEETAALMGLTTDMFTDENIKNTLENSKMAYLFYAMKDGGLQSINMIMENVGLVGNLLTPDSYIALSMENLETSLSSAGFTNIVIDKATVAFAGEERPAITITADVNGSTVYEVIVPVICDKYVICTTVCTTNTDECAEVLTNFYQVGSSL